eukprot:TRINITY_DN67230_c0_g1_i1.p1 TRINITY_DN67230_c0_g1~~TRINITY_DN67230_c0_g1_i1.p1  ORF type:complete len:577 (-),score=80.97 TRINITY_DN67230_c0_g1_i1:461-2146(-)
MLSAKTRRLSAWSQSSAFSSMLSSKSATLRRRRARTYIFAAVAVLIVCTLVLAAVSATAQASVALSAKGRVRRTALLKLESLNQTKGRSREFLGILADWSAFQGRMSGLPLVKSEPDPFGCTKQPACERCAIVVLEGRCTFIHKAKQAETAGAKLLIVVSASDDAPLGIAMAPSLDKNNLPTLTAVMISKQAGSLLLSALARAEEFVLTCQQGEASYSDFLSEIFVGVFAVSLVVLGAWHSVEDLRRPTTREKFLAEVFAVEEHSGYHFMIFGSVMLTLLFFFMRYLIYVIVFLFSTSAVSTATVLLEPLIAARAPALRARRALLLPAGIANTLGVGEELSYSELISGVLGASLALGFVIFRNNHAYGWLFQNTISVMLLLTIQRTLRLPNLRVGTLLLTCTFFFDIFWVFVSPWIFNKSVMIEVATGGGTGQSVPMVIKIPSFGHPEQIKILGLGDIAIPGLLISFLLRHDLTQEASRCTGYFVAGVAGYALGLVATFVSLYIMKHGQPALLFLVPGVLLPTFAIAWRKGELATLWTAEYGPDEAPEGYEQLDGGSDKDA